MGGQARAKGGEDGSEPRPLGEASGPSKWFAALAKRFAGEDAGGPAWAARPLRASPARSERDRELLRAVSKGDLRAAELALANGAKPNACRAIEGRHGDGMSSAMLAAADGRAYLLYMLASKGANLDLGDAAGGRTALMFAAGRGREDCLRLLLGHRCDMEARDDQGMSAAAHAADGARWAALRLLLEHGADPAAKGPSGESLAGLAAKRGAAGQDPELLALLESGEISAMASVDCRKARNRRI